MAGVIDFKKEQEEPDQPKTMPSINSISPRWCFNELPQMAKFECKRNLGLQTDEVKLRNKFKTKGNG